MTKNTEIDFDAHYSVDGYKGIAFYLLGWAKIWDSELEEEIEDSENVIAVMVGDNRKHTVHIDDLTKIEEKSFCRECGQIGCGHNVYE